MILCWVKKRQKFENEVNFLPKQNDTILPDSNIYLYIYSCFPDVWMDGCMSTFFFSFYSCSDQNTYFAKVIRSAQKPRVRPLSRTRRPFRGPLAAILDFAGSPMFLMEEVLGSKNLFSKSCLEHPIT